MNRIPPRAPSAGFTFVELVITLALIGIVATAVVPLYEVTSTRFKEAELRLALRTIRTALDAYKAAADSGALTKMAGESGYPASLDLLVEPMDMGAKTDANVGGSSPTQRIVILRRLPRDPFYPDADTPAAQTWNTRSYGSRSDDPQSGSDIFDVSSKSTRTGLDGRPYAAW